MMREEEQPQTKQPLSPESAKNIEHMLAVLTHLKELNDRHGKKD